MFGGLGSHRNLEGRFIGEGTHQIGVLSLNKFGSVLVAEDKYIGLILYILLI